MKIFKNILVVQKTSKLQYLIAKYGNDSVKKSDEYSLLKESMDNHIQNCEFFIKKLSSKTNNHLNIDIITDHFELNDEIYKNFQNKDYDLVFSLGGDGTFLRSAQFLNENLTLVGVNTDSNRSKGFYCSFNLDDRKSCKSNEENLDVIIENIINQRYSIKSLNKLEVHTSLKKYYFINDLYFGEKFLGRISKYKLNVKSDEEKEKEYIVKSSGIIFSTCIYLIN